MALHQGSGAPKAAFMTCIGGPLHGERRPNDGRPTEYAPVRDRMKFVAYDAAVSPEAVTITSVRYTREWYRPCWAAERVPLLVCELRDRDEWQPEVLALFGVGATDANLAAWLGEGL